MKEMKALFAVFLLAPALLSSCFRARKEFVMATGGASGTYYPLGAAVADIWNSYLGDVEVNVMATGASVENIGLLDKGGAQVAIVQNDVLDYAWNGTDLFEDEKIDCIQAIGTLYPEVVQIAASPESGITDVRGLRGRRVSLGDLGSGAELNAKQILEGYGLSFSAMDKRNLSFYDSAEAMRNGKLDACFVTAGIPNAALQELAMASGIVLVPVSGPEAQDICRKYPFYTKTVIPGGTYRGTDGDVQALSVKATLVVSSSMSEDTVYRMTKALFEHLEELGTAHPKGRDLSAPDAISGVTIHFHPGAVRYYRECGAM